MSDQHSDAALPHDMHLKPLDNAALLKPLRKIKTPDIHAESAPRPFVPREPAPAVPDATPAVPPLSKSDPADQDTADYTPRHHTDTITPEPEPTQQPVAYTPELEIPKTSAVDRAVQEPAPRHTPEPAQEPVYEPVHEPMPVPPAPVPAPAPAAQPGSNAALQHNTFDPTPAPEPIPAPPQRPAPAPAPDPVPVAPPPVYSTAANTTYTSAPPPIQNSVPRSAPAPAPEPSRVNPAFTAAAGTMAAASAAGSEEDDAFYDSPANTSAPDPSHPYQPTDEQMHMMEIMKNIFSTVLSTTGAPHPPEPPAPETKPLKMGDLRALLITLQQKIRDAKIPVVIVIEGMSASGKGTMLSKLVEGLDSRAYSTHPIRKRNCVEKEYPPMWRYWTQMPSRGNIALFCSSWYGDLNKERFASADLNDDTLPKRLNEIISMESQLICDGTLILKFFLHISQQEQHDRLKKMEQKKSTAWQVDDHDHEQNKRYDEYMEGMDNLMSITNLKGAPWYVIDATDLKACAYQMYQTVIQAFEDVLNARKNGVNPWDVPMLPNLSPITAQGFPLSRAFNLDRHLEVPYRTALRDAKKRLAKLQIKLYRKGIPMVIGFEGWDAAGKGGAIHRLNAALDARGFTVKPVSAPSPVELSHHYMWRFWKALPPKGHITIFDRTWYGRVMVERVEKLCTQPQWQRAYEEINRFEKLLTDNGVLLCKFWLQIDPDTQLRRFEERKADPEKQWKLTDEDWRNRAKWDVYEQALDDMLQRTNTANAPWTLIEANDKEYARVKVLQTVIDTIEKHLGIDEDDD